MKVVTRVLAHLIVILFSVACTTLPDLNATQSEVRDRLGAPTEVRAGRDGGEVWEYRRDPRGRTTIIVRFALEGRVASAEQVLTEENFHAVRRGVATKADVRDRFGRPAYVFTVPTGEIWEYHISDVARRPAKISVQFAENDVVRGISKVLEAQGAATGLTP